MAKKQSNTENGKFDVFTIFAQARTDNFVEFEKKVEEYKQYLEYKYQSSILNNPYFDREDTRDRPSLEDYIKKELTYTLKHSMFSATISNEVVMLNFILKKYSDLVSVYDQNSGGLMTVHMAALYNKLKIVKHLINTYKISPDIKSKDGMSVIDCAEYNNDGESGRDELISFLHKSLISNLQYQFYENFFATFEIYCHQDRDVEQMKEHIFTYANSGFKKFDNHYRKMFTHLYKLGKYELLQFLYQEFNQFFQNADLPIGINVFQFAINSGYHDVILDLLDKSNFVNNNNFFIKSYLDIGDFDQMYFLVAVCGYNPDTEISVYNNGVYSRISPIFMACEDGNFPIVKFFIEECGVAFNLERYDGFKIATITAAANNLEILRYLVNECGVSPNEKCKDGSTPLLMSCAFGNLEIVKFLIGECGVNVDDTDTSLSPLAIACGNGRMEIVRYLIEECNAEYKVGIKNSQTPLNIACHGEKLEVVQYLINHCNVNPFKNYGKGTAIDFARNKNNAEIIKFIMDSSSSQNQEEEDMSDIDITETTPHFSNAQVVTQNFNSQEECNNFLRSLNLQLRISDINIKLVDDDDYIENESEFRLITDDDIKILEDGIMEAMGLD